MCVIVLMLPTPANTRTVRHVPAWVPGMGFMRRVTEVRELVRRMIDVPYERVRESLVRAPSFQAS